MSKRVEKYNEYRQMMNEHLLSAGTIIIPHTRKSLEFWDDLQSA